MENHNDSEITPFLRSFLLHTYRNAFFTLCTHKHVLIDIYLLITEFQLKRFLETLLLLLLINSSEFQFKQFYWLIILRLNLAFLCLVVKLSVNINGNAVRVK